MPRRRFTSGVPLGMKFLCLIYEDPVQVQQLPKAEFDKFVQDYLAFTKELEKSRHLEAGDALAPGHTPTTIRMHHGKPFQTFGPQENIKNTIGGFYVIKAKDLEEAIALMSRVPGLRLGSVEIRPIYDWQTRR
jgi:hypothetical protein